MTTAHYIAKVIYNEDFKKEMDKFLKAILRDKKLEEICTNKNQRFSAAIRAFIEMYNDKKIRIE
jgi:hypothetical protein